MSAVVSEEHLASNFSVEESVEEEISLKQVENRAV
jgi:hypothetical protein